LQTSSSKNTPLLGRGRRGKTELNQGGKGRESSPDKEECISLTTLVFILKYET
jgi:hypothetical protein